MPDQGNIDPAKAVQGVRQQRAAEEAERQRKEQLAQEQRDQHRANVLNLLRYADQKLEEIPNPVVSEFVVTERWYTPTSKKVSDKRKLRPGETSIRKENNPLYSSLLNLLLRQGPYKYSVATVHERQARYYGSWLSLETYFRQDTNDWGQLESPTQHKRGLVKLHQPHSGYAMVNIVDDCDPRRVSEIIIHHTDRHGREEYGYRKGFLRKYTSLKLTSSTASVSTEIVVSAETVARALDFVETG